MMFVSFFVGFFFENFFCGAFLVEMAMSSL